MHSPSSPSLYTLAQGRTGGTGAAQREPKGLEVTKRVQAAAGVLEPLCDSSKALGGMKVRGGGKVVCVYKKKKGKKEEERISAIRPQTTHESVAQCPGSSLYRLTHHPLLQSFPSVALPS